MSSPVSEVIFTKEELEFRNEVRGFLEKEVVPQVDELIERDVFPRDLYKRMGELGLLGQAYPPEYGGKEKVIYEVILAEEIGAVFHPLGVIWEVTLFCTLPIARFGTEEQKTKYLEQCRKGKLIGAIGITEPEAGCDIIGSMQSTAKLEGDQYVINGEKRHITCGSQADIILVWTLTNPAQPAKGMSAFIVETKDTKGFEVIKDFKLMGGYPCFRNSYLRFNNAMVPKENLVGKEGDGAMILFNELDVERVVAAAGWIGEARPILELATRYSTERKQFGKPISEFEAISFRIADMATKIEAARLLIYHAARIIDSGLPCTKEAAMAKLFATEALYEVAHNAVQIMGGRGLTEEYPMERYFRCARIPTIPAGTNEMMRFIIQRQVYKELKAREP